MNIFVFWYALCVIGVLISVGALYSTGLIGNYERQSLMGGSGITAAVVGTPIETPIINNTDINSTVNITKR